MSKYIIKRRSWNKTPNSKYFFVCSIKCEEKTNFGQLITSLSKGYWEPNLNNCTFKDQI